MQDKELVRALRRIRILSRDRCIGCGHENRCSEEGCAILREAAQRLERPHGWIPTAELLPPGNEDVLVCRPSGRVERGRYTEDGWWYLDYDMTRRVTHWMPIPEGPKGGA